MCSPGKMPVLVHNTGPACSIGPNGWPVPTMDNCKACATEIQKIVGGDIVHIKDAHGAPALGPSVRDPYGSWTEHFAVVKEGTVYDGFTGGQECHWMRIVPNVYAGGVMDCETF